MANRESARRFHFLREIASGGFGSVYLAKVMHADGFSRLAAIKLLHRKWSENEEIATRMRDEARLLGWLRHRNIVDVISLTSIDGRAAVIMEYLEAVDLKHAVQELAEKGERVPPRAAMEIISFVASALDAAYNRPPYQGEKPLRVIHRDIKPSNIMVDESGTVKVLDFGVARAEFENRESHTSELQFGSVDYMPPERLFFEPETDLADVYSLGATLFELLSGERLGKAKGRKEKHDVFLGDRLSFLAARCPLPAPHADEVSTFIRSMCSYHADGRPPAAKVVQRCRALTRDLPGETLSEWSERVIPAMVKALREAPREPNPLTDSVIPEDSVMFSQSEAATLPDGEFRAPPHLAGAAPNPGAAVDAPAAGGEIPRGDARWEMLRRAALAEISASPPSDEDPGDPVTQPPTVERASAQLAGADYQGRAGVTFDPGQPAPEDEPVEQFDDEPTRIGSLAAVAAIAGLPPVAPAPPPAPRIPLNGAPPSSMTMVPADANHTMVPDDDSPDVATVSVGGPRAESRIELNETVRSEFAEEPAPAPAARSEIRSGPRSAPPPPPPAPRPSPPPRPAVAPAPKPMPVPRAQRPAPKSVDPFEDPPPRRGPGLMLAGLLLVGVLGGAGLGAVFLAWQFWWVPSQTTAVVAPVSPAPSAAAVTPTPAPAAATPPPADAIVFSTTAPGVARITASCDGKDYNGTNEVAVPGPSAANCLVKVVMKDRSRLMAEVKGAKTGSYTCFSGGGKECSR